MAETKSASPKIVKQAKQAYQELVLIQNHLRAHRKVMTALPKWKIPKYQLLGTQIQIRMFNAHNKWNGAIKKLSQRQIDELYLETIQ